MSASSSLPDVESLVAFCPSCLRLAHVSEFSECSECGEFFCGKASNKCVAVCRCDREAFTEIDPCGRCQRSLEN